MQNNEGNDKRVIMIAEIEYWRKHKLLKEHYCDFLSNLYLENQVDLPKSRLEKTMVAIKKAHFGVG